MFYVRPRRVESCLKYSLYIVCYVNVHSYIYIYVYHSSAYVCICIINILQQKMVLKKLKF